MAIFDERREIHVADGMSGSLFISLHSIIDFVTFNTPDLL